jgi:transposase-like protein
MRVDALTERVREAGHTVNISTMVADGSTPTPNREVLDVATARTGPAGWRPAIA